MGFRWIILLALCGLLLAADQRGGIIPNDPDFKLQWALQNTGQLVREQPGISGADIDALGAWAIHRGTPSVTVAIVGRGIHPHPEFADRLLTGRAFLGDLFDTLDPCSNDTHAAGIIAAAVNDGLGIAGLVGEAKLLPVRVVEGCLGDQAATAEGIIWAINAGASVILVPLRFSSGSPELAEAVVLTKINNVILIAPAGDGAGNPVAFPAAYDDCMAVSATTNRDELSVFSNVGPQVEIAAPGRNIWSTFSAEGYAFEPAERDTISAAAFVTGVAALIRSYAPQLGVNQVKSALRDSADDLGDPGRDIFFGSGRLSAARALQLAQAPALRFEWVDEPPTTIPPGVSSGFTVRIVSVGETVDPSSAQLFARVDDAPFAAINLTPLGDDLFAVALPAVPCQATLEYYLSAAGNGGTVVTEPLNAPASTLLSTAVIRSTLFEDDFETDQGWDIEGGDSTSGRWSRVVPVGTREQPGFDFSPNEGRVCYITGQHFGGVDGSNDVDGGPMLLTTPVISLPTSDAEVSYARWFSASHVGMPDSLIVEVSRDGGSTWRTVEVVGAQRAWIPHSFRLSDIPEAVGDELRIRFSVCDCPNDSLVEAGVDEFRVVAIGCTTRPGDVNNDGTIDLLDHRRMGECWTGPVGAAAACGLADLDMDGTVGLADYGLLQTLFAPE